MRKVLLTSRVGHSQTCAYPYLCLGIDSVSKPLYRDKGSGRYTKCLPCSPFKFLATKAEGYRYLFPGGGLYQIYCQSLNTHGGTHRSGGAQRGQVETAKVLVSSFVCLVWLFCLDDRYE